MYYCPGCGHHHGKDGAWLRCGAVVHDRATDAASKCGCVGEIAA